MKGEYKEIEYNSTSMLSGVNKLLKAVLTTYGPNGSNVILFDNMTLEPYPTKDGVSVAKALTDRNPYTNAGMSLVKQAALNTLDESGDGTSTSILLATSLILTANKMLNDDPDNHTIRGILKELTTIEDIISKELKSLSKQIIDEDVFDISMVSTNGDIELSKLISDAYKYSKVVKAIEGNTVKSYVENINGMQINTTLLDESFQTNSSNKSSEYLNPNIILIEGHLTNINTISKLIYGTPTVIIAEEISDEVMATLKYNYNRGNIKVLPIRTPGVGAHRKNLLEDLSIYTGAPILSPKSEYTSQDVVGKLSSVTVNREETILSVNKLNEGTEKRIEELTEYLGKNITTREKELTEIRIDGLKGSSSIIHVGGNSISEIKEKYDRFNDAIKAVKCSYEEGVVKGGGLFLLDVYNKYKDEGSKTFRTLLNVLSFLSEAIAGGNKNFKVNSNVVDPSKVIRVASKNAISVSRAIIGSKATIIHPSQWRV